MIIPVPAIWARQKPEDPNDRIERVLYNRSHRVMAGLSIDDQFQTVTGALVVTVGNGKYLRLQHAVPAVAPIPHAISKSIRGFLEQGTNDLAQLAPIRADLAEIQSAVVERLKSAAGKYVDRVMAVAVNDPGLWTEDFDGRRSYNSFCDATKVAELSGVTVIDAFPARDIAAGGNGSSLDGIPLWLALADRHAKVAKEQRAIVTAHGPSCCYRLPPSDGLDAEVPDILRESSAGFDFLQQLVRTITGAEQASQPFEKLYANGVCSERLQAILRSTMEAEQSRSARASGHGIVGCQRELANQLLAAAQPYLAKPTDSLADLVQTCVVTIVDELVERLLRPGHLDEICVAAIAPLETCLINRFQQQMPEVKVNSISQLGFSADCLPAVIAALLGLLHIRSDASQSSLAVRGHQPANPRSFNSGSARQLASTGPFDG